MHLRFGGYGLELLGPLSHLEIAHPGGAVALVFAIFVPVANFLFAEFPFHLDVSVIYLESSDSGLLSPVCIQHSLILFNDLIQF